MLRRLTRCSSLCGESSVSPRPRGKRGLCEEGLAPLREQVVRLGSSLLPMGGPTRPTPGVPFVSRRKEPKACWGCAPGPPEGGTLSPLRRCRPPNRVSTTKIDRFATLSWWANRSFFLPKLYRGSHFLLLIRGSAGGKPPRMLEGLSYRKRYR